MGLCAFCGENRITRVHGRLTRNKKDKSPPLDGHFHLDNDVRRSVDGRAKFDSLSLLLTYKFMDEWVGGI